MRKDPIYGYNVLRSVILKEALLNRVDPPPVDNFTQATPNTNLLDVSDFAMMTKLVTGETRPKKESSNIVNMLMNRQNGQFAGKNFSKNIRRKIYNRYVPNRFDVLIGYFGPIYCSDFTKDGQHFITTSIDKKLKIYNSANGSYNLEKSMDAEVVIERNTDLKCSPNNEHFVYSSRSLTVYLGKLAEGCDKQYPLVVDNTQHKVSIRSVSFSAEGRELLCACSNGTVYIYDVESQRTTLKFPGHTHSVNSVMLANYSNNILYSAGDDGMVKLWDRRTLSEGSSTPEGYLIGHRAEIIDMDQHGDGCHLITHSRDESIKLWDVRKLSSAEDVRQSVRIFTEDEDEDEEDEEDEDEEDEEDEDEEDEDEEDEDEEDEDEEDLLVNESTGFNGETSIMTYTGHKLDEDSKVRCRFSPVETTGQRYIYTGCASGRVVVYDALTGKAVQHKLHHKSYVYNVSWHPTRNEILSIGRDGIIGIWTYMNPENVMEPEQIEIDKKLFDCYRIMGKKGVLVDITKRRHKQRRRI